MYLSLPERVLEHFKKENIDLFYADTVDSTNKRARIYAQQPSQLIGRAVLFVAEGQSEGRGRLGRSFFSPDGTGLYMTLLIPAPANDGFSCLTALTSVAVCEAVVEIFKLELGIKWVNDLYLDGKKVAGILAEAFEVGESRYVAIGIGINLTTEDFPDGLSQKAGSLTGGIEREELCALKIALAFSISKKLLGTLESGDISVKMEKYRESSCVLGKRIRFTLGEGMREGEVVGITDGGALRVRLSSGELTELSSGEISVFSVDGKWN